MASGGKQPSLVIYPLSTYTFGQKPPVIEKHGTVPLRMERLKEKYAQEGIRRSVDAVLIVHAHNHPHILLLQLGSTFFKLPGGRLRPGEDEISGLLRKLGKSLAPENESMKPDWRVGDLLATFYRPNFENLLYPYCPPHVERPKEIRSLFLVHLPEKCFFSVPKNQKLLAVPLFEVYDHTQRYGPIISAVPQLLSRYAQRLVQPDGGVLSAPGGQPLASSGQANGVKAEATEGQVPQASPTAPVKREEEEDNAPAEDTGFVMDFDD